MHMLIWVFVERLWQKMRFLTLWLIYEFLHVDKYNFLLGKYIG